MADDSVEPDVVKIGARRYQYETSKSPQRLGRLPEEILGSTLQELCRIRELLEALVTNSASMLEVLGQRPDGGPAVLKRSEGAPAQVTVECHHGVDGAGFGHEVYAPPADSGWGRAVVLTKRAQRPFFDRWGKALAAQGLWVRVYVMEDAVRNPAVQTGNHIKLPDDIIDYAMFRHRITEAEAITQARAAYDAARQILGAQDEPPTVALVWGHSEHWHRAPAMACRNASVQTLHFEGAMFPRLRNLDHGRAMDGGHAVVNRGGQYYENASDIGALWRRVGRRPLTDMQAQRIDSYIGAWRGAKASKYGQPGTKPDLDFGGGRVLFVPLQIDVDASIYFCPDKVVSTGTDLLELLGEATKDTDWHLLVKPHPLDSTYQPGNMPGPAQELAARYPNVRVLGEVSIHDCFEAVDAVCAINSTVLLEGLCYDLPAITMGSTCFTGKGFTFDVRDRAEIAPLLRDEQGPLVVDDGMRRRFRRFLHMMMWEGNNGCGFFVDIENFDALQLVGT